MHALHAARTVAGDEVLVVWRRLRVTPAEAVRVARFDDAVLQRDERGLAEIVHLPRLAEQAHKLIRTALVWCLALDRKRGTCLLSIKEIQRALKNLRWKFADHFAAARSEI